MPDAYTEALNGLERVFKMLDELEEMRERIPAADYERVRRGLRESWDTGVALICKIDPGAEAELIGKGLLPKKDSQRPTVATETKSRASGQLTLSGPLVSPQIP